MGTSSASIRGITKRIAALQQSIQHGSTTNPTPDPSTILSEIKTLRTRIQEQCRKKNCYPADLTDPSYRAYLWLAFLSTSKNFSQHIAFIDRFLDLWNAQSKKSLSIALYNHTFVFQCKPGRKEVTVAVNEGFLTASPQQAETLVACCLKSTKRNLAELRRISRSEPYQAIMREIWQHTPQSALSTAGDLYNLQTLFQKLNAEYFSGKMVPPRLRWSGRTATRRLGYYHPDSDTITISKFLDQKGIPSCVMEYVLYHEMLHKHVGLKKVNSYRIAHSSQFKNKEKRYKHHQEAERFLRKLQNK